MQKRTDFVMGKIAHPTNPLSRVAHSLSLPICATRGNSPISPRILALTAHQS
jgi:hypothetical protein